MSAARLWAILCCLGAAAPGVSAQRFTALLSSAQQWPAEAASPAFGVGDVLVDAAGGRFSVALSLSRLANETMVHVHVGLPFEAGPAVQPLPLGSFGPAVYALTPSLLAAITTGRAYINVHTIAYPAGAPRARALAAVVPTRLEGGSGEIRGQITGANTVGTVHLSGTQAGTADASAGRGLVFVNASGAFVSLWVSTRNITAISLMYKSSSGTGTVVCALPAVARFVDAACALESALVSHLRAGFTYIKVFSATLPGGESARARGCRALVFVRARGCRALVFVRARGCRALVFVPALWCSFLRFQRATLAGAIRGIVTFAGSFDAAATLNAAGLSPIGGAAASATGSAQLVLAKDGSTALAFAGLWGAGAATGASLNGSIAAVWSLSETAAVIALLPPPPFAFFVVSVSAALRTALRSGATYVSVAVAGGGSLRGSFPPAAGVGVVRMTALLSGAQQWPAAVPSAAFGVASVDVDAALSQITVSMTLTSLVNETVAQIHVGTCFEAAAAVLALPIGASVGPSVFNVTSALLEAILTGRAYINIYTAAYGLGAPSRVYCVT